MKLIKFVLAMFIVAIVAALLFNFQSFTGNDSKSQAGFCINCHEEKPYYYTWLVTSHNQFGCLKCHKDVKPTTFIYKHIRGAAAYKYPFVQQQIVANATCEGCHSGARNVSPPGDVIFPHQLHVVKQIDCVDCHSNVVHLNISQRIAKKEVVVETFNEVEARKLIKNGNSIPMPVCMRCHNGDMATNHCNDCHKNIKTETIASPTQAKAKS